MLINARIFDAGFGEILRSPLLQWAEKHKLQPDSRKPGVTDPSISVDAYFEEKPVNVWQGKRTSRAKISSSLKVHKFTHGGERTQCAPMVNMPHIAKRISPRE